jgi:hypothetical protein
MLKKYKRHYYRAHGSLVAFFLPGYPVECSFAGEYPRGVNTIGSYPTEGYFIGGCATGSCPTGEYPIEGHPTGGQPIGGQEDIL